EVILYKADHYGIKDTAWKFLKSYLQNRQQLVQIGNFKSKPCQLSCGVPHVSILGPVLFLVVVIYIVICIKHQNADVLLYADDSTIICSGETAELTACIAKRTLQKLQNWCSINRMVINSKKTKAIPFGFSDFPSLPLLYDGEAIEYVDSA